MLERRLPGEKYAQIRASIAKMPGPHFYTQPQPGFDPKATLEQYKLTTADQVIQHFTQRLNLIDVAPEQMKILQDTLNAGKPFAPGNDDATNKIRAAVSLMMTLPAYQLN
jgi:hypothetical protein